MAKLEVKLQKIFADIGATGSTGEYQVTQFGSLKAAAPLGTLDPAVIQALSAYDYGFINAIINGGPPAIQDMDGLCRMLSIGIAYQQQAGIAEYNAAREYHIGSFVSSPDGNIFRSVANNNIGNAVSDTAWWMIYRSMKAWRKEETDTLTIAYDDDNVIDGYTGTSGVMLPAVGAHNKGRRICVYKGVTGAFILIRAGGDTVDGTSTYMVNGEKRSTLIQSDGVNRWDVIRRGYG